MTEQCVLDEAAIAHKIRRIAAEIDERHPTGPLAFVGIHTRGVVLAQRVAAALAARQADLVAGTLDIALYRDDLDNLGTIPTIRGSDIPFAVEGAVIVLFDDVLFTGRTIRAALDELVDYGRPARIELAVLIDRGHRELPIAADYLGEALQTGRQDHVAVCFEETDGRNGVFIAADGGAA